MGFHWFHSASENLFYYAPAMVMAGALSVTPIRPYVRTFVRNYVRLSRRRPLSNSNIFLSEFYETWSHCVEFKFDNGPYRTRL